MTGTAIANVIGGPLSGLLLTLDGKLGLAGWQWLFVVEGIPAVLLGIFVLYYLTEGSRRRALADRGRAKVADRANGSGSRRARHRPRLVVAQGGTDQSARVVCGLLYFTIVAGFYGITFWLPQIMRSLVGIQQHQGPA